MTRGVVTQAINTAHAHADKALMKSSAYTCLNYAEKCLGEGLLYLAFAWVLRSLSYSVGKFSPAYKSVEALGR